MAKHTDQQQKRIICLFGGIYIGYLLGYVITSRAAERKKESAELWQAIRELRKMNNLTAFTGRAAPTMEPMPVRVVQDER